MLVSTASELGERPAGLEYLVTLLHDAPEEVCRLRRAVVQVLTCEESYRESVSHPSPLARRLSCPHTDSL